MNTTENTGIPMPATMKELKKWIERLNNAHARLREIEAERAAVHKAVDASFAVVRQPHEAHAGLLLDGITAYVLAHMQAIKRWHGRTVAFGPSSLTFRVSAKSVTTVSEPELVTSLIENKLEEYVRYEPRADRVALAAANLNGKLGKVVRSAGAYVARHEIASLSLPALDKPVRLFKRRYPFVPRNEPGRQITE